MIDLRSDTVTLPSEEMREAMAMAVVGDDVYGEDPTVNELERVSAEIIGKEAALFVPTGTMGNQIAILTHTLRGDEIIVDELSHIALYEVGAASMFAGVQLRTIPNLLEGDTVEKLYGAYRESNIHAPRCRLLCLENTFNIGSGTVMPLKDMRLVYKAARGLSLFVHLDGARIFNASIALGCDVKELTENCDSVMFCLSKGLGAPVGSILAGSKEFINAARKYRKAMGGGMRQVGVLAAAGLIALKMAERLSVDHDNARLLAQHLSSVDGLKVDLSRVQTNILLADISGLNMDAGSFVGKLSKAGVKAVPVSSRVARFVTHKEVTKDHIIQASTIIKNLVSHILTP